MKLLDDPAFARVAKHLEALGAGACARYKGPCLERRLASRLRARKQSRLEDYAALLDTDAEERRRLLAAVAIGVTSFFRNPSMWRRLAEVLRGRKPTSAFRGWSAGCASGEEAYSIAMLLAHVERDGVTLGDWAVDGTDLDERNLVTARAGRYPARVVQDIEACIPPAGVIDVGRFEVASDIRDHTRFDRGDITAPAVRGPYELVMCRNVLIYLNEEGQAHAFANLIRAVVPGGLLVLGRAEMAARSTDAALAVIDSRERIYQRVA